jgi:hypothetical protein
VQGPEVRLPFQVQQRVVPLGDEGDLPAQAEEEGIKAADAGGNVLRDGPFSD